MENKKITSYLLYAIGEILLVVIGILLAVGINDWNTSKKNQVKIQTNVTLLIESLQKDSIYYQLLQDRVETDVSISNGFFEKLRNPSTNLDSLKKIVSEQYKAGINTINFQNDDPYQVMVQSGEITLLDKTLRQQLFSLYSNHDRIAKSDTEHFDMYHLMLTQFRSKYGNPRLNSGPVFDAIWKEAKLAEVGSEFIGVLGTKLNHYRLMRRYLEFLIPETNTTLEKLRETL